MEVSTEISQKIRSAIKAKLMELGAYVDDELPDYIMVMVANKKSRAQMSHDLGLFLGGNTETFTGWLHGLLSKLQTITVDSGDKKKDKVKASKEKKKDRKEGKEKKSKKRSSSESKKRSSSVGDKSDSNSKQSSEIISKESNTESTTRDNEHTATKPVESVQKTSDIVIEITEQEEIPLNLDLVESDLSDKNKTESTKIKNVHEDVEDVRQLLVTVTQADELAEELETTEQEVEQSRQKAESFTKLSSTQAATQENETKKKETVTAHLVNRESLSRSPSPEKNNLSTISRKRKIPTSVVASVRRGDEEEYDPYNPAVGSVASVVKVTTRKSSVPASLQANRALLMKAMSDAEKSIAVKRKIGVTRPMSRADSPAEVYSPKRKREQSHAESSPPPYIPSRKEESSRHRTGQHTDHRTVSRSESGHLLSREDRKELISRSRREELLRTIGIDSSHKVESLTSPERKKEAAEKVAKYERHAKDDVEAERKFQITSNVVKGSSAGDHRKERSPSPPTRKSVVPSQGTGTENKNPISERLGKIVVERRRSADYTDAREEISRSIHGSLHRDAREDIKMRSIQSSVRHDAREDIKARSKARQDLRESKSRDVKHSGARVLSQLGRDAVQKQCQAAVMSVTTSKAVDKSKHRSSPDSRVVCCDTKSVSSDDGKDVGRRIKTEHLEDEAERMGEEEPEDLAHMIGDDLEPEILEPQDEFTLDLDEDDITNVVGDIVDDVEENTAMEKPEQKLGTRFIVTLDGVDERQFDVADGTYDKFRRPLVGSSMPVLSADQQNEKLLLGILATHGRPMAQGVLQQGVLPITRSSTPPQAANKLQPPKIQPFSISLKDSDDEHEEKDHKPAPSSYEQTNVEMEAEISPIKRAKMSERCKFWPACAAGSACEYHHPTTHCKTFPNCKFGTNCLFIHPNCRYDSKCSRPDCPFTHTSRRSSMANAPRVIAIPQPHVIFSAAPQIPHYSAYSAQSFNAAQTTCRFYPNCLNVNCAFLHPKPCRFGVACKSSSCPFYHPPLPEKSKLKWQAQISEPKESLSKVPVVDSSTNSPTIPTSLTAVSSTSQ